MQFPIRPALIVTALSASLVAAGCGSSDSAAPVVSDAEPAATSAGAPDADAGYPVTVDNCGTEETFAAAPDSVVVLARPETLAVLLDLGVADAVSARAGAFPDVYFDDAGREAVDGISSLGEDLDDSGHLQISQEAILASDPDLVIGAPDGIDRDGLEAQDIPVIEQPANCPDGGPDVSYEAIYDYIREYGDIFAVPDRAEEVVTDLQERVAAIEDEAEGADPRTVAILYPTVGGGTTYAYGAGSMSHLQADSAGLTNVFSDSDERVFEVTGEELISRNPDVLVLLHVDGEPGPVEQAVRDLPGADAISAVANDEILTMQFSFGEYLSPLIVDGLEQIVERFDQS